MKPGKTDIRRIVLEGGRVVTLMALDASVEQLQGPFIALVPAFDAEERAVVERMATRMIDAGCVEFCCVGPEADALHDTLDWNIIEEREALDIVTTGDTDYGDACEYFLFGAGAGRIGTLVALVSGHEDVVASLERAIRCA